MLKLHIERLKRLPQRPDETWQGGLVRLPTWVGKPGEKPYRPWAGVWTSVRAPLLHLSQLCRPEEKSFARALGALVEFACDRALARYCPGRLEVRGPALAEYLREELAELPIAVEVREELATLDAILADLGRTMAAEDPRPAALEVPGVTVARMRAFAEAAKAFYEAAPWQHLANGDLICVEAPAVEPELSYTSVMGQSGIAYGLAFFRSPEEYQEATELEDAGSFLDERSAWAVNFDALVELPIGDADLWEDHGLAVAAEEAYAWAVCMGPGRRCQRPDAKKLGFLEGLLRALAQTSEQELDSGRWEKRVATFDGEVTFRLSLPGLLEQMEGRTEGGEQLLLGPFLPDPRLSERVMGDIHRILEEQDFASLEEANEFAAKQVVGRRVPHPPGRTPLERAQDLVYGAMEARGRRRVQLARKALETCPDCADAYVLLAEHTGSPARALELYAQGVAAGERALGKEMFEREAGQFWGLLETRPYMRARLGVARCLSAAGRKEEAAAHYREMLRLNPNDNQGVRDLLAVCLLELGQDEELEGLLARYGEDDSALWLYARALLAFRREGDSVASRRQLQGACKANRHVARYLLGKAELPPSPPPSYGLGDESEAVCCAKEMLEVWKGTPGASSWLASQTKGTPRGKGKPRSRKR